MRLRCPRLIPLLAIGLCSGAGLFWAAPALAAVITSTSTNTISEETATAGRALTVDFGVFDFGAALDTASASPAPPADCAVTVNWGDGTSTLAVLTSGVGGQDVSGTHAYALTGSYDTALSASSVSAGTGAGCTLGNMNYTQFFSNGVLLSDNYNYNTVSFHTTVSPAPTPTTSNTTSTTTQAATTSQSRAVDFGVYDFGAAYDTAAGLPPAPADCAVTINWGDGTSGLATLGTLGADGQDVSGTHAYAGPGVYTTALSAGAGCALGTVEINSVTVGDVILSTDYAFNVNAFATTVTAPVIPPVIPPVTPVPPVTRIVPPVTPPAATVPVNSAAPTISGRKKVKRKLTASNGLWTGTAPLIYTYKWESCNAKGRKCKVINGATASTFKLSGKYAGRRLEVVVSAHNSAGQTSATSKLTPVIKH
jgi:hypothetical protein